MSSIFTMRLIHLKEAKKKDSFGAKKRFNKKLDAKSELVLQFVSNCKTSSQRENYVAELAQHMKVTQMSSCSGKSGCKGECAKKLFDAHYFYLAFENSICQDYVTEKFWNIKKLIVPVVLRRQVFANLDIPNDTFIAVDDFGSARELAAFLEMVANNRSRYMNYLQWTKRYKRSEHRMEIMNPLCQLCGLSHEKPKKEHKIADIEAFWHGGGQCLHSFADKNFLSWKIMIISFSIVKFLKSFII